MSLKTKLRFKLWDFLKMPAFYKRVNNNENKIEILNKKIEFLDKRTINLEEEINYNNSRYVSRISALANYLDVHFGHKMVDDPQHEPNSNHLVKKIVVIKNVKKDEPKSLEVNMSVNASQEDINDLIKFFDTISSPNIKAKTKV